jgi:dihydrofolate reductase
MIIGIVAIARNFAIGKDGKLPWHYPPDLKFFKGTTTGNAVVMGWTTWLSIGKPLPNRRNVVLSRTGNLKGQADVTLLRSKAEVLDLAKELTTNLYIIGGSQTYRSFANEIEKWYVTEIPIDVDDADTFMPRDFLHGFEQIDELDLGDGLRVKAYVRPAGSL